MSANAEQVAAKKALQGRMGVSIHQLQGRRAANYGIKLALGWASFPQIGPRKMQTEFEPLITSERAAELLGIHPKTLQRMARERKIPAVRIGKFWRFRKSDLDSWVRASVNCSGYAYRSEQETV